MGQLVDGVWQDVWYDTKSTGGRFKRSVSAFRNWLTADGAPGPSGEGGFAAEKDRYHLYVSLACPWAHRTLIVRELKGLESLIPVSVVNPLMLENGWTFDSDFPAATGDELYHHDFLYQLYLRADPHYTGRVTVPVLWDKKNQTIVSNESAEIIRMFNTAFDAHGARAGDYYPVELREKIDELNGWIYDNVNNGVYKAGFATSQEAYDEAVGNVFGSLERLEQMPAPLKKRFFLRGTGPNAGKARVVEELRQLVEFRQINLLEADWSIAGELDAIFCRNVMI
ncbi:MAG: CheR family methyltransferase, partial [Enterobacter hormaechei]|nr:CheR family methyltransferase [Enterobacter hormaechei]